MDKVAVLISMASALGIFWSCVCRLQKTHRRVIARVRYRYAIMGTGALCMVLFPFMGMGLYGATIFFVAIAVGFWLDRDDWKNGVPESATMPGELHEFKPTPTPTSQGN